VTAPDVPVRPGADTLIKVKINGEEYHAKYVKACHTCTHPARLAIEEALLGQHSYQAIASQYSGVEIEAEDGEVFTCPELSWTSVRTHYRNGHMPLEVAALRALADKRSEELADSYNGTLERHVSRYEVAETILAKGYERILSGATPIDAGQTLAAAKFLHDAEQGSQVDAEAWSQAMQVYFEVAQELMPEDIWAQFVQRLSVNPVLKAIERKMNSEDGVIEGEIVE
jgi:hypothetical protein